MSKLLGVLVNVGSNETHPNGRGRIFEDFTFEYLPIPELRKTGQRVPTYRKLGFKHVKCPDLLVHVDPGFETFTYGHVRRGFGDIESLLKLTKNDVLFFYATLKKKEKWSTYIIGYFRSLEIYDCRKLSAIAIANLRFRGFGNNAHLKRLDPSVDLLIKGGRDSTLLNQAFPLADSNNPLTLQKSLTNIVYTVSGKRIKSGTPWFRWTLICKDATQLLNIISRHNGTN